jgi:uncharacterized Zn finger protein (UPF0148 family)
VRNGLSAEVTCLGDLRCPHCGNIIVTPAYESGRPYKVLPGEATCIICSRKFEVTEATSKLANKRLSLPLDDLRGTLEELLRDEGGTTDAEPERPVG